MVKTIWANLTEKKPLVQAITNYVTVNDCANIILACGASPIMADNPQEAQDIARSSSAVLINIGTPNFQSIEGMLVAGKMANQQNIPVIFDPVGVGASQFRNELTEKLLAAVSFSVIRGNISEIKFLAGIHAKTFGVDASIKDAIVSSNVDSALEFLKSLSSKTGAVIAVSGATDIVTDKTRSYIITNGHPVMARITGSGCMLSSVIAAFTAANPDSLLEATATATIAMGICGEQAHKAMVQSKTGTASFRTFLIDAMSNMTGEVLTCGAKYEVK